MNQFDKLFRVPERPTTRRGMLRAAGCGFGAIALAAMMAEQSAKAAAADSPSGVSMLPRQPHFPARAKRVIFLFMHGGPSSVDTFDPKVRLDRDNGKPIPMKLPLAFAAGDLGPVSSLFPHVAERADDLCVIRSMVGEGVDHGAALLQTFTGSSTFIRPSMGSWALYGLGTENQDLPGFVTIKPTLSHGGAKNWSSAFLLVAYQGTAIGNAGLKIDDVKCEPIEYLLNNYSSDQQRFELDMLQSMNKRHAEIRHSDPELEARIQAYELAFRMQSQAPEAFQVDKESDVTQKLYGLDDPTTRDFGWQCLLARRLAERGVRYIQCTHSYKWDQHGELFKKHTENAKEVDKPIAGLLTDLKARGLLKDTLVIWAGEFGRTPISQGGDGRDHNPYGYSIWMAGGGVKPGFIYGATDEFGYHAVEDRMHIHDFHATVLALLGLQHDKLTYRYSGRDFRLTDVAGVVANKIMI